LGLSLILEIHKINVDMMDQDTANEDASDDSEDNLPTSKPISKKRKMLPIYSEDEDSTDNLAKHGQRPSPLPLDDEEAVLNNLFFVIQALKFMLSAEVVEVFLLKIGVNDDIFNKRIESRY
jgi:hypothetical protein